MIPRDDPAACRRGLYYSAEEAPHRYVTAVRRDCSGTVGSCHDRRSRSGSRCETAVDLEAYRPSRRNGIRASAPLFATSLSASSRVRYRCKAGSRCRSVVARLGCRWKWLRNRETVGQPPAQPPASLAQGMRRGGRNGSNAANVGTAAQGDGRDAGGVLGEVQNVECRIVDTDERADGTANLGRPWGSADAGGPAPAAVPRKRAATALEMQIPSRRALPDCDTDYASSCGRSPLLRAVSRCSRLLS